MLGFDSVSETAVSALPAIVGGVHRRRVSAPSAPIGALRGRVLNRPGYKHADLRVTSTEVLVTATTWTAPAGVDTVTVEVWGGGGAGQGNPFPFYLQGGGGGAYSRKRLSVVPGTTYTVNVGAGGVPNPTGAGGDGGDSWFGSSGTVLAKGGKGGNDAYSTSGAPGGAAASGIGDTKYSGGHGGASQGTISAGGGGGSSAGTASDGNAGANPESGGAGGAAPSDGGAGGNGAVGSTPRTSGAAPGGGGGGADAATSTPAVGAGGLGQVRLTYLTLPRHQPLVPRNVRQVSVHPDQTRSARVTRRVGRTDPLGTLRLAKASRTVHPIPVDPQILLGHVWRRGAVPPQSAGKLSADFRVVQHPVYPNPNILHGRVVRRAGHSANVAPTDFHVLSREIRQFPLPAPLGGLRGKITRCQGHAPNQVPVTTGINFRRVIAPAAFPLGILHGRIVRHKGVPANIFPTPFLLPNKLRRTIRQSPPPPGILRGHLFKRHVIFQDALVWLEYYQTYEQGFRVADDSFAVYEMFVGEDGPPNFVTPVATGPTFPLTYTPTPPVSGTKTLHIVVRARNKYDLSSFNVYETLRVIDSAGDVQPQPVSAPQGVAVYDGATGYIRVVAKYVSSDDGQPANTWDIYVKIGSAPVPGVDTVTYTASMVFLGPEAGLSRTLGPYTPGTVAYVVAVARRLSDGVKAAASAVTRTLASPPDLTDGSIFGGSVYEQR